MVMISNKPVWSSVTITKVNNFDNFSQKSQWTAIQSIIKHEKSLKESCDEFK